MGLATAVVAVEVQAGDVLCPALDPAAPAKLTKATPAALTAGTMVAGVAAAPATAGGTVSYYPPAQAAPTSVTGLGAGIAAAVVADEKGRCARQNPVAQGAFVVGSCDTQGVLAVAPKHDFANVLDFGARGDDQNDDWAAITRAMGSLDPIRPGVLYFPAGNYRISRPLHVDREQGRIELLGESEHTTTIRFFGPHGPALCVSPKTVGHLPTADALLTGNGKAGVLRTGSRNTINLRDSPALDLNGAKAFSVACTVRPDELPGGGGAAVLSSSGKRLTSEKATSAFGVFLGGTTGKITVTATACLGGKDYTIIHPGGFPVGQTLHLALVWDGTQLCLYAGPPGTSLAPAQPPEGQRPASGATLTQPVEEGVYVGVQSTGGWPEYRTPTYPFTGRIDSIRITEFAIDRDAERKFTAPTAKFPEDFASNVKTDPAAPAKRLVTRMLINFDRDAGVFTVGSTWLGQPQFPIPVYLMHQWSDGIPANAITTVRRLEFQSPSGAGVHAQLSVNSRFSHLRVTASRDGVRLRNNSYLVDIDHLYVAATRLGLTLGSTTTLANVTRFQTAGTQYDFVATDVVSVHAQDWYIGGSRSIVPLLLTSAAYSGHFHGVGVVISSEDVQRTTEQTWLAAVATSGLPHFTLENSTLETVFLNQLDCPPVLIDESLVPVDANRDFPGSSVFLNCYFEPSPKARANIEFSGRKGPGPVRLAGNISSDPAKPWVPPENANLVSHLGGCVSTTDSGQTQWRGGRDWVFAHDTTTGRIGARERETQGSGIAGTSPALLAAVPLAPGASRYRAEVMATDAAGHAATWVIEQGLSTVGTTVTPWSPQPRVLDSFGSAGGSVPTGWVPPEIVASGGNAVVRCSAPSGLTLAFTVKLQTFEGLAVT
ncbi:glycosyl hydrolase family 28-related protein [Amycolatopsis sp. NPDC059027]|uniref:glycosyl hydrolase family 28-related protein n=1 Tax=Amycolatopsis sp. NPDC059027 TaxID=3346709 RepID=UPI0036718C9E